jgi:hypothetical protein
MPQRPWGSSLEASPHVNPFSSRSRSPPAVDQGCLVKDRSAARHSKIIIPGGFDSHHLLNETSARLQGFPLT